MPTVKKTYRIEEVLVSDIVKISDELGQSESQVIESALKLYRDYHYMQNKASIINDQIIQVVQATCDMLENKINRKTNSVLSELAIQSGIQNLVLAESLEVNEKDLHNYRLKTVDHLKTTNKVLRLDNE